MSIESKLNQLIKEQRITNRAIELKQKEEDLISEDEALQLLGWTKHTMHCLRKKKLQGCFIKLPSRKYLYYKSKLLFMYGD
jgi:hypothetical protein